MSEHTITLSQIAESVNNVNMDREIVAVDERAVLSAREELGVGDTPIRFDAMIMILVHSGSATIRIDLQDYPIGENSLIFIQPQHFVSYTVGGDGVHADILACSRRVVEEVMPRFTDIFPVLMATRNNPVIHLSPEAATTLHTTYNFLRDKIALSRGAYMKQQMICLLQGALFEVLGLSNAKLYKEHDQDGGTEGNLRPGTGRRSEEIMARFIFEVSEHFIDTREVSHYASRLGITPKHLSAVVKAKTGMTAGRLIERYVVMEARMLLKTTDLTIQEIASRLNFPNQSAFGKYFKNITGFSPSQYRMQ